jgi:quinol monooxygenase YgiN
MAGSKMTPEERQDYDLAIQYVRSHPVLSKMVDIIMIEFFDQIDAIKEHVGMPHTTHLAAKKNMVKKMQHKLKVENSE